MNEKLLKQGFVPYMGEYEKKFYDVVLKNKQDKKWQFNESDRHIVERCWPNAGNFHAHNGRHIKGRDVLAFRESVSQSPFVQENDL